MFFGNFPCLEGLFDFGNLGVLVLVLLVSVLNLLNCVFVDFDVICVFVLDLVFRVRSVVFDVDIRQKFKWNWRFWWHFPWLGGLFQVWVLVLA